jgi:hypothetical protein
MEIEKEYEKLKKKYAIPDFNKLNLEFEITTLDSAEFLLRSVRKKIVEKIEALCKILEEILQPEANLSSMVEGKAFSDNERKKILELYKELMFLNRSSVQTSLKADDAEEALFISESFKEWAKIKKQMSEIIEKIKRTWKEEFKADEELGYLG